MEVEQQQRQQDQQPLHPQWPITNSTTSTNPDLIFFGGGLPTPFLHSLIHSPIQIEEYIPSTTTSTQTNSTPIINFDSMEFEELSSLFSQTALPTIRNPESRSSSSLSNSSSFQNDSSFSVGDGSRGENDDHENYQYVGYPLLDYSIVYPQNQQQQSSYFDDSLLTDSEFTSSILHSNSSSREMSVITTNGTNSPNSLLVNLSNGGEGEIQFHSQQELYSHQSFSHFHHSHQGMPATGIEPNPQFITHSNSATMMMPMSSSMPMQMQSQLPSISHGPFSSLPMDYKQSSVSRHAMEHQHQQQQQPPPHHHHHEDQQDQPLPSCMASVCVPAPRSFLCESDRRLVSMNKTQLEQDGWTSFWPSNGNGTSQKRNSSYLPPAKINKDYVNENPFSPMNDKGKGKEKSSTVKEKKKRANRIAAIAFHDKIQQILEQSAGGGSGGEQQQQQRMFIEIKEKLQTVPKDCDPKRFQTNGRCFIACEQCKRRKMRCTNEIPTCSNCQRRGTLCKYAEKVRTRGRARQSSATTTPTAMTNETESPEINKASLKRKKRSTK